MLLLQIYLLCLSEPLLSISPHVTPAWRRMEDMLRIWSVCPSVRLSGSPLPIVVSSSCLVFLCGSPCFSGYSDYFFPFGFMLSHFALLPYKLYHLPRFDGVQSATWLTPAPWVHSAAQSTPAPWVQSCYNHLHCHPSCRNNTLTLLCGSKLLLLLLSCSYFLSLLLSHTNFLFLLSFTGF